MVLLSSSKFCEVQSQMPYSTEVNIIAFSNQKHVIFES